MRRKCYLPKSFDELKNLSDKKLQFYWDTFYTYPMIGHKAKLRPLWYAIQCELGAVNYRRNMSHGWIAMQVTLINI